MRILSLRCAKIALKTIREYHLPMPTFKNKKRFKRIPPKPGRVGEDIDMLRESNRKGGSSKASSSSYKDHIDGA